MRFIPLTYPSLGMVGTNGTNWILVPFVLLNHSEEGYVSYLFSGWGGKSINYLLLSVLSQWREGFLYGCKLLGDFTVCLSSPFHLFWLTSPSHPQHLGTSKVISASCPYLFRRQKLVHEKLALHPSPAISRDPERVPPKLSKSSHHFSGCGPTHYSQTLRGEISDSAGVGVNKTWDAYMAWSPLSFSLS